ncbi:hypothetical protein [Nostoc sp.]
MISWVRKSGDGGSRVGAARRRHRSQSGGVDITQTIEAAARTSIAY